MATIDSQITAVRYDVRDEYGTEYSTALLTDYFNRAVVSLAEFLANIKSDWVLNTDTLSLLSGGTSVALPSDFNSPRMVYIGSEYAELTREDPQTLIEWQRDTSTGQPDYYGIHKTNMIFERETDQGYSIYLDYNQKADVLSTGDSMPYNDEFNEVLRSAVAMLAKNRNDLDFFGDHALHALFSDGAMGKVIHRKRKRTINLGF